MRIISGQLKGRRIKPPANNWPTRPTTDFAKEALYNILQHRIDFEEMRMLDLFGGAGNHSLECISRGCQDVTYVDLHPPCCRFVEQTVREWGIETSIQVRNMDVFAFLALPCSPFTFIFAGPPYALPQIDQLPEMILTRGLLAEDGDLVIEHDPTHDFTKHPRFVEVRQYGQTHFSFFA